MKGCSFCYQLPGSKIVKIERVAIISEPIGQDYILLDCKMNEAFFVLCPKCFYPSNKYTRILATLCINWLTELCQAKESYAGWGLINFWLIAFPLSLNEKPWRTIDNSIIIKPFGHILNNPILIRLQSIYWIKLQISLTVSFHESWFLFRITLAIDLQVFMKFSV